MVQCIEGVPFGQNVIVLFLRVGVIGAHGKCTVLLLILSNRIQQLIYCCMLLQREKINLTKMMQKYTFDHLTPPPEVYQLQKTQDQIVQKVQKQGHMPKRLIFYKVPYSQQETEAIQKVRDQFEECAIFEEFTDELILKHIHARKFDLEEVLERLQQLQHYHNSPLTTKIDDFTLENLQKGCLYTYGHDREYHPIVILRPDRFDYSVSVDENYNFVYYLILVVMGFRMVPYHAERYVTLVDFNNMDFTTIPFKYLFDVFEKMNVYNCGNNRRAFIYNSKGINNLWRIAKNMIPNHTLNRIIFIEKGKEQDIYQYIDPSQLETKYAGNLKTLTNYWPPQAVPGLNHNKQDIDTEFFSVDNDTTFFDNVDPNIPGFCGHHCDCTIF